MAQFTSCRTRWSSSLSQVSNKTAAQPVLPCLLPLTERRCYTGNWFDASQIYRQWALAEASWTRAGNLSARGGQEGPHGVAEWLIETPFWAEGAGTGAGGVASFCTGLATSLRLTNMGYFWSAARPARALRCVWANSAKKIVWTGTGG